MEVQRSADSIPMDAKYQLYQEGPTQPPKTVQRPLERIMWLYHLWYMCQTWRLAGQIYPATLYECCPWRCMTELHNFKEGVCEHVICMIVAVKQFDSHWSVLWINAANVWWNSNKTKDLFIFKIKDRSSVLIGLYFAGMPTTQWYLGSISKSISIKISKSKTVQLLCPF